MINDIYNNRTSLGQDKGGTDAPLQPRKRTSRKMRPIIHSELEQFEKHFTNRWMGLLSRLVHTNAYTRYMIDLLAAALVSDPEALAHMRQVAEKQTRVHCEKRIPQVDKIFQDMKNGNTI